MTNIMTDITPLVPRQLVPSLAVSLVGGGRFDIAAENPERFTMLVFYRGLHCPICRTQLGDLETKLPDFAKRGVSVVAISSDNAERAERSKREWRLPNLRLGFGLDLRVARAWGLYVSTGRGMTSAGVEEPALFSEPGLFLVRADHTLYFASVQTMPFARPHFADILGAIDFVIGKDYPARGEVNNLPAAAA
ncbi:peroxiredoxin [Bradyrhizobium sp. AZCC 1610]|uniref:peroxiredoxin-like family protein n=1 Tax=Bradyrhizobium sp. AZCC 1610 TaxID=3117020 RepID=UPI002FEF0DC2